MRVGNTVFHRYMSNKKVLVGLCLSIMVVLMALLAKVVSPFDPFEMDLQSQFVSPSKTHLLGTDRFGRDILSRVLYGTRTSLLISVQATIFATLFGAVFGIVAGYVRVLDNVMMRALDLLLAFPPLLAAIILVSPLGRSPITVGFILGIVFIPGPARLVRSQVLSLREEPYVEAAKALGSTMPGILWRHILPNVFPMLIVQATVRMAFAVLIESALSFLGLGVPPPTPSLGRMISEARRFLSFAPHAIYSPGIAIVIFVTGINLLGDGLRDVLDPTMRHVKG